MARCLTVCGVTDIFIDLLGVRLACQIGTQWRQTHRHHCNWAHVVAFIKVISAALAQCALSRLSGANVLVYVKQNLGTPHISRPVSMIIDCQVRFHISIITSCLFVCFSPKNDAWDPKHHAQRVMNLQMLFVGCCTYMMHICFARKSTQLGLHKSLWHYPQTIV